jgi:hypothetical protein
MMDKQCRHISVYLDDTTYAALMAIARKQARSLSSHVKTLIEREINGSRVFEDELLTVQKKILIGVDGLLKYHDNKTVYAIVQKTRSTRFGGSSDEA